jgi:hypothetical protein
MGHVKTHYLNVENLADLQVKLPLLFHQIKQEQDNERLFKESAKAYEVQRNQALINSGKYPKIIYKDGKHYVIHRRFLKANTGKLVTILSS